MIRLIAAAAAIAVAVGTRLVLRHRNKHVSGRLPDFPRPRPRPVRGPTSPRRRPSDDFDLDDDDAACVA